MKTKNVFLFSILTMSLIVMISYFTEQKHVQKDYIYINGTGSENSLPVSLKMYEIIEELSTKYKIPKHIAYNVAYMETRYRGPFDWKYNPYLTSSAGAEGPMQIITRYAHRFVGRTVTPKELRTDLEMNVEVSMKMLKKLYGMYGRWDLVLGYYNTGYPQVNEYASFCSNNKDYRKNWVSP